MLGKKVLADKYVNQLYHLFQEKQWEIEEIGEFSTFDRFCSRLSELEDDSERDFILELTEQFLWVRSSMYEKYLIETMKKLFDSDAWKPDKKKNIYICALTAESDFGKLKSNTFMLYMCQSILLRAFSEFHEQQVRICETPEVLKQHKDNIGALILIDDYIGSGETALGCLKYLEFLKDDWGKLYVLSLVAQEEGVENILKEKVPVYTAILRKKGITDVYEPEDAEKKLEQMQKIGRELGVKKELQLGYVQTESLVAMIKTPNNTFPIYWYEGKKKPYAPFPRKENVKVIRSEEA